ncbi:MAG: hypothetical protein JXR10_07590 [Cyclobacteriaceae bacterium]
MNRDSITTYQRTNEKQGFVFVYLSVFVLILFSSSYCLASDLENNISEDFEVFWLKDSNDQYDISSIEIAEFAPLKGIINRGFDNGIYWLKIVPKESLQFNHILEIPFVHTTYVESFANGKSISARKNTRFKLFDLTREYEGHILYARVNCKKEALIPIKIQSQVDYQVSFSYFSSSSYYVVLICVLILHLICFYEFGKGTYLNYCLMLISFGSSLAYRDGVFNLFLDPSVHEHIEIFFNLATAYALAIFTYDFLDHKYYIPRYKWWGIGLLIVASVGYVIYLFNPTLMWYVIADNLVILSLGATCCTSLFIYRRTFYAKAYAWAYFPMLILTINFYDGRFFGIDTGIIDANVYRVGGIFEMAVFSYAIIYRASRKIQENIRLKVELDYKERELSTLETSISTLSPKGRITDNQTPKELLGDKKFNTKKQFEVTSLKTENEWNAFVRQFKKEHEGFFDRLNEQWPALTLGETKLLTLSRMRLGNKEMAAILGVKTDAIRQVKSRVRKKMGLNKEINLIEFSSNI